MKNTSVFMFCLALGLLIVFAGTTNILGALVTIVLAIYFAAVCIKLEPRRR